MFNKICNVFTKMMMVWVISVCIIGYIYPQSLLVFKPYLDWLFAGTMLGIGAILNPEDFIPIFKKPQLVILGTIAQFAIMPALGFLIAKALHLTPHLALGIILVGTVPGAMASNVISYLAKADVAYSIAMTAMSTLLSPVLTPLFTYIYGHTFIDIPMIPMVLSIIKMVILPLLIGFGLKHFFKEKIDKISVIFPAVSSLFIALICGLVIALNKNYLISISAVIFIAVFFHNLFGLLLGYSAGILYRFDIKRKRTLAFEVGMQNAGLGAVLALKHFSSHSAIPNALFAVWCIITASFLAEYWRSKS